MVKLQDNSNGPPEVTGGDSKPEGGTERSLGAVIAPTPEEKLLDGKKEDDDKSVHSEELETGEKLDTKVVHAQPAKSQSGAFKRAATYCDFDDDGEIVVKEGTPDEASKSIKVSD